MNEINLQEMSLSALQVLQRRIGVEIVNRKRPEVGGICARYRLMCDKMKELVRMDVSEPGRECNKAFWRAMVITALMNDGYRGTDIETYLSVKHCMAVTYRRTIHNMLSAPAGYKKEINIWNKFNEMIGDENKGKDADSDNA